MGGGLWEGAEGPEDATTRDSTKSSNPSLRVVFHEYKAKTTIANTTATTMRVLICCDVKHYYQTLTLF